MSGFSGVRVFVFGELFDLDQRLRGQARALGEVAGDLHLDTGPLPPEAQAVVAGLKGLAGLLDRAADTLLAAATAFGQTGADASRADLLDPFTPMLASLKGKVVPPGGYGPLGPYPWLGGQAAFLGGTAATMLRSHYGYRHWVKDGPKWPINGSGPRAHPEVRQAIDRTARIAKIGGLAASAAGSGSRRLKEGASVPEVAAGTAAETATVRACATAGAQLGVAAPIPHPLVKGGAIVAGGVIGGTACSGPARWVGDRASDAAGEVADVAEDVGGFFKKKILGG
ncbi:hypothetical protein [Micromonospora sp. NPDC002575]|uniref:hypothetical protein n=1 Tax=Micromonospora sp. NPDC002575 TaxID=3364222 RepID=UPI0036C34F69